MGAMTRREPTCGGGGREGAFAVAIAERPHSRHVGAQLIVDDDVAAFVPRDTSLVGPEIVCVRPAADREQQVRPANFGRSVRAIEAYEDIIAALRDPDAFRLDAQPDAFALENLGDRG